MQLARRIARESYTVDYAGFWIRSLALLIDGLILGVIVWVYVGLLPLAFGRGWMGGLVEDPVSRGGASGVYWVLTFLVVFLMVVAYLICFWRWRGQTPGKMITKVKVVRFTGEDIGWGDAVMRFLGYIISILIVFSGLFWVAYDSRRQGWHDKIADTYVIRMPRR